MLEWLIEKRHWAYFGVALALCVVLSAQYQNPEHIDLTLRLHAPSTAHWLGTDQLGRDVLSRILQGARLTFGLAIISVCLGGGVGIFLGVVAGYKGGWPDALIMRIVDVQLALPSLLLALLVVTVLGPGIGNLACVLVLTSWTSYARVVRGHVLQLRGREFILSTHAIGASLGRIILRHIVPNVAGTCLVVATLEMARVVIVEASLSFLGLGIQPPFASWGRMLVEGQVYLARAWWVVVFPGLAILLCVLVINAASHALKRRFSHVH